MKTIGKMMRFIFGIAVALAATVLHAGWTYDESKKTLTDGNWTFSNVTVAGVSGLDGNINGLKIGSGYTHKGGSTVIDFTNCKTDTGYAVRDFAPAMGSSCPATEIIAPDCVSITKPCMESKVLQRVVVSPNITWISDHCFYKNSGLTSFSPTVLPGITEIKKNTFRETSFGGDFVFANVTSIKDVPFYQSRISSISLPKATTIPNQCFYQNTAITNFYAPNVTQIGPTAFYGCSALQTAAFAGTLTSLGSSAFYGCSSLTSMRTLFPELTEVPYAAFCGVKSLRGVWSFPNATSVAQSALSGVGADEIYLPLCESVAKANFQNSPNLAKVTMMGFGTTLYQYQFQDVNANGNYQFSLYWSGTNLPENASYPDSWFRVSKSYSNSQIRGRLYAKPAAMQAWLDKLAEKHGEGGSYSYFPYSKFSTGQVAGTAVPVSQLPDYPGDGTVVRAVCCGGLTYAYFWLCDWLPEGETYKMTVVAPENAVVDSVTIDGERQLPLPDDGTYIVSASAKLDITYKTTGTYVFEDGTTSHTVTDVAAAATIPASTCNKAIVSAVTYTYTIDTNGFAAKGIADVSLAGDFDMTSVTNDGVITWSLAKGLAFTVTYLADEDHGFNGGVARTFAVSYPSGIAANTEVDLDEVETPVARVIFWEVTVSGGQAYLTDGNWKLKIETDKNAARIVTVTNPDTLETYTGYQLMRECATKDGGTGSGKLDLTNCRANTGYPVVALAAYAFYYNASITEFVGPEVVSLSEGAFQNATALVSGTFSSEIYSIGKSAFYVNQNLKSSLETISPTYMPKLTGCTLCQAFFNCLKLTGDFYFGRIKKIDTSAFNMYNTGCPINSVEAPLCETIEGSFAGCKALTNAVFESVRAFNGTAFGYCTALSNVVINGAIVTNVGQAAFNGVPATNLPTSWPVLQNVGAGAFASSGITGDVSMPEIVKSENLFDSCKKITSAYLPKLANYGYKDFYCCSALTNVTLNGSASFGVQRPITTSQKMGTGNAFEMCTALREVVWLGKNAPTNKITHAFSALTNINYPDEPVIVRVRNVTPTTSEGAANRAAWEAMCTTLKADLTDAHKLLPNYDKVKGRRLIGYIGGTPKIKLVDGVPTWAGQYYSSNGEYAWIVSDDDSGFAIIIR